MWIKNEKIFLKAKISEIDMLSEQQRIYRIGDKFSTGLMSVEISHDTTMHVEFGLGTKIFLKMPFFFDGKKKRKCPVTEYYVHTAMPITSRTRSSCIVHRYILQLSVDELF